MMAKAYIVVTLTRAGGILYTYWTLYRYATIIGVIIIIVINARIYIILYTPYV